MGGVQLPVSDLTSVLIDGGVSGGRYVWDSSSDLWGNHDECASPQGPCGEVHKTFKFALWANAGVSLELHSHHGTFVRVTSGIAILVNRKDYVCDMGPCTEEGGTWLPYLGVSLGQRFAL
jgi:hypothetical protein